MKALEVYKKDLENCAAMFESALPITARKYLTPDRLTRVVLNAMSQQPKLMQCTRPSILRCVMDCVQLGLEVGGTMGLAYLVPFKNGKTGKLEATTIIGYKGYIQLAMRSGLMRGPPVANLVKDSDLASGFFLDRATLEIKHPVNPLEPSAGDVIGAYCVAQFVDGGRHVEWMDLKQIMAIKARSRAKKFGPWVTDEEQMMRKTVIRRAKNYWPVSVDMVRAFELDDQADDGHKPAPEHVYDQEFAEVINSIPEDVDAEPVGDKTDQMAEKLAGTVK